jgi:hypothetical protein
MTRYALILVVAATAPLGCVVGTTTPTGSGGSTSTTTATTTTGDTTSGTGGAGDCTGAFTAGACATCGEASCCDEGAACKATTGCIACVYSSDPACTEANKAAASALVACLHASCEASCFTPTPTPVDVTCSVPAPFPLQGACVTVGGAIECNPVTNELCDAAKGEACDFKGAGYHCYPGPNERSLCEACGPTNNAGQCKPGSTCRPGADGNCGRFCCDNADCGAGKCDKSGMFAGSVGVCVGGNP